MRPRAETIQSDDRLAGVGVITEAVRITGGDDIVRGEVDG